MNLSQTEIENIARLARLELSAAEKVEYTRELNRILGFMSQLDQLDTTGVEPMAHVVSVTNVFRPDRTRPSLAPEEALANAPERVHYFFKVPKVLEE